MGWVTLTLRKRVLKQSHAQYQMRDLQISREKRQLARRKQYETAVIQNEQSQAITPLKLTYNETIDKLEENRKALTSYLRIAKEIAEGTSSAGVAGGIAIEPTNNGEYAGTVDGGRIILSDGTALKYKDLDISDDGTKYTYYDYDENNDPVEKTIDAEDLQRFSEYDFTEIIGKYDLPELSSITKETISSLESTINSELSNIQMEKENAQLEYTEETDNYKTFYEDELAMLEEDVNDEETMLDLEQSDVESQMEAISQELQSVGEAVSSQIQSSTIKLA